MQKTLKRGLFVVIVGLGIGLGTIPFAPLAAQDEIILTLGVQEWQRDLFTPDLFTDFYAEHPGVKVVVVSQDMDNFLPPAAYAVDDYLEGLDELVATADVLHIYSSYMLSPEGTQTGAFLDLAPLVTTDTDLNADDFYPAVWESFQWDRGIWAIPVVASVNMLLYDAAAFDEAGYPYPDETWTSTDFFQAARALAQYDTDGEVIVPGFLSWSMGRTYAALTGNSLVDETTFPGTPLINTPELAAFLEEVMVLQEDGIINNPTGDFDTDQVPMVIDGTWRLNDNIRMVGSDNTADWQGTLLPGNTAFLDVQGLAVSAGTEQPELAYALAQYLSANPEAVNYFYGDLPARRSLSQMSSEDGFFIRMEMSEEAQALINRALENATPISAMRFADYVNLAYSQATNTENPVSIPIALQDAEAAALTNLETAAARQESLVVQVATPVPTPVLAQDEVALHFYAGIVSSAGREEWESVIDEFIANDPQVRHIELAMGGFNTDDDVIDCFYEDWYGRITNMDMTQPDVLSLDPFMDADPLFDRADVLPLVLEQVEREGRLWGYPMVLYPEVMWYNYDLFTQANAIMPETGWTATAFNDAIQNLSTLPDSQPVFVPMDFSGTYILMLMAAYGALPYDHRTDPPTINVTDPVVVDSMRQVLDLARDGSIKYQALGDMGGGGGGGMLEAPIYTDSLNTMSWILRSRSNPDEGDPNAVNYRLTTYPTGTEFAPLSYSVGIAYVDADTPHADACYRWISHLAQQPELFSGMPVRQSQLDDPNLAAAHGEDIQQVYRNIADQMTDPQALVFGSYVPTNYRGGWLEMHWLYGVFDRYVQEDADLETELNQFAANVTTYRECLADVPDFSTLAEDISQAEAETVYNQFVDCAIAVDPSVGVMFGR